MNKCMTPEILVARSPVCFAGSPHTFEKRFSCVLVTVHSHVKEGMGAATAFLTVKGNQTPPTQHGNWYLDHSSTLDVQNASP